MEQTFFNPDDSKPDYIIQIDLSRKSLLEMENFPIKFPAPPVEDPRKTWLLLSINSFQMILSESSVNAISSLITPLTLFDTRILQPDIVLHYPAIEAYNQDNSKLTVFSLSRGYACQNEADLIGTRLDYYAPLSGPAFIWTMSPQNKPELPLKWTDTYVDFGIKFPSIDFNYQYRPALQTALYADGSYLCLNVLNILDN